MQNKVTVTINGQEYNLVASEDAAYMTKVAGHVDAKNLRAQIKGFLEESADLKNQLSKAKQEIFKLQNKK